MDFKYSDFQPVHQLNARQKVTEKKKAIIIMKKSL